jgi:hypothetical protein
MPAGEMLILLAQLRTVAGRPTALSILLWCGLAIFTVAFGVLTSTQWGQSKPLVKCLGLSLFAHLLLLTAMWGTTVFYPHGASVAGDPNGMRVRLDALLDEDAAPAALPMPEEAPELAENVEPAAAAPQELLMPPERKAHAPPLLASSRPASEPVEAQIPDPTSETPMAAPAEEPPPPMLAEAAPPEPLPQIPLPTFVSQPAVPVRPADNKPLPEVYRNRSEANRTAHLKRFGGTPDTEAAVAAALDWMAIHQSADGRWRAAEFGAGRETNTLGQDRGGAGARADTGITALALLAFLGAGETHYEGQHRENVQHALEFLVSSQAANGSLAGQAELFAQMYCHGMATLALSEAWATSGDERLAEPVRRAIRFTLDSQHSGGGWRYQPLDQGDMSQFGWQLMALKSAEASGLKIPDSTRDRMIRFLRSVSSGQYQGLAAYRPSERPSRTMTAEAAMCRIFLNAENSPGALDEAVSFVREELPGMGRTNYYYWYYGTIAMFQRQGPAWNDWNAAMQQRLLSLQRADGDLVGTWDPDAIWGGYGGRIYSTALATLCLEVYYRYLPLYGDADRLTSQPENVRPR